VIVVAGVVLLVVAIGVARRRSTDGYAVELLRALLRLWPPARQEWITAMLTEDDALDDPRLKRRFARGCLRALAATTGSPDRAATVISGLINLSPSALSACPSMGSCIIPVCGSDGRGSLTWHCSSRSSRFTPSPASSSAD
jgi:hypothetical protein